MTSVSRGYLTVPRALIEMDPWAVAVSDGPEMTRPGSLTDWNYHQPVRVRTVLRANSRDVRDVLELANEDALASAILWSSSGTGLRGRSHLTSLADSGETVLELVLEPGSLRQQVQFEVVIALRGQGASNSLLAPKDSGAVVWGSDRYAIDLEGLGSRLPVVAFPFSKRLPSSKNAQWWMHFQSLDLDQPVDSVLWMWLNDEHPYVVGLLHDPENPASLRSALHLSNDFHRQLLELAISHDELVDEAAYLQGSLGETLISIARLVSPDLERLRATFKQNPWLVETQLQAAIGFHIG